MQIPLSIKFKAIGLEAAKFWDHYGVIFYRMVGKKMKQTHLSIHDTIHKVHYANNYTSFHDNNTLTAHFSTDSEQTCPQPLKQHNKSLSQSPLLLHSLLHIPTPVTLGHVRLSAIRS